MQSLVQSLVQNLSWCRVSSTEARVSCAECRVASAKRRISSAECRISNAECRVSSAECRVQSLSCRLQSLLVYRVQTAESPWCTVQNAESVMQTAEFRVSSSQMLDCHEEFIFNSFLSGRSAPPHVPFSAFSVHLSFEKVLPPRPPSL